MLHNLSHFLNEKTLRSILARRLLACKLSNRGAFRPVDSLTLHFLQARRFSLAKNLVEEFEEAVLEESYLILRKSSLRLRIEHILEKTVLF